MPAVITPASDDAPRDPGFTHTELRHLFLRATAKSPDGWAGSFMTMSDMGEREFAAATTTPFGDRLNEYGESCSTTGTTTIPCAHPAPGNDDHDRAAPSATVAR